MKVFFNLAYIAVGTWCVCIVLDDIYRARKAAERAQKIAECLHADFINYAGSIDEILLDLTEKKLVENMAPENAFSQAEPPANEN